MVKTSLRLLLMSIISEDDLATGPQRISVPGLSQLHSELGQRVSRTIGMIRGDQVAIPASSENPMNLSVLCRGHKTSTSISKIAPSMVMLGHWTRLRLVGACGSNTKAEPGVRRESRKGHIL